MSLIRLSVGAAEIEKRVRARLCGGGSDAKVAWGEGGDLIVLQVGGLKLKVKDGWVLVNLEANKPSDPPSTVQLVYFVGKQSDGDGLSAASTVHAVHPAAIGIAGEWGAPLQRVVWDGILDIVEGVVNHVAKQNPGKPLELVGFDSSDDALHVEVLV